MFKFSVFCQIVFLFSLTLINHSLGEHFDYEHQDNWYDEYKECSQKKQSPIELYTKESISNKSLTPIVMKKYDRVYKNTMKLENNGHSADILFPKPNNLGIAWQAHDLLSPSVSGGLLGNDSFIAESLHFHWGSKDNHGSEHIINSKRYSMEMHIVHRNSKYETLDIAKKHADGLAVVAVLFQVDENLSNDYAGLNNILEVLPSIKNYGTSVFVENFSLENLLAGLKTSEYFTYEGSLSTPPCSEAVTWTIFSKPIHISSKQMAVFREILDEKGNIMQNNYRSLQPKSFRKIYIYKNELNGPPMIFF